MPWVGQEDDDTHDDLGKPFKIKSRIYNNRLIRAREELRLTCPGAAEAIGISYGSLTEYERLALTPWSNRGGWKASAEKIAAFYGYSCDELWPEIIQSVKSLYSETEVGAALIGASTARLEKSFRKTLAAVSALPLRERLVIEKRFGLNGFQETSLDDVAKGIGYRSQDYFDKADIAKMEKYIERLQKTGKTYDCISRGDGFLVGVIGAKTSRNIPAIIEQKALRKLRNPRRSAKLKDEWQQSDEDDVMS